MKTHEVRSLAPETLHGHFSAELPPTLAIDSGDRLRVRTLDVAWGRFNHDRPFEAAPPYEPHDQERDPGHALTGPFFVRGAEPGMTLEVRVLKLRTAPWGWNRAGGYPSPANLSLGIAGMATCHHFWSLDPDAGTAVNQKGHRVRMSPFLGIIGMPPAEPGKHSTTPPRSCGGNLDCRELVQGSVLFLPIPVKGALLSVGDGHALQGDGEVSGPALECPMEDVELEVHVRPDLQIDLPRARTPAGWVTLGMHEDMNQAWVMALNGMLTLMTEIYAIDRAEATVLASLVVSLRISQVVNGVVGVHALLPEGALEGVPPRA